MFLLLTNILEMISERGLQLSTEEYSRLMDQGLEMMDEQKYEKAEITFRRAVEEADEKDSIIALNNLALALHAGSKDEAALEALAGLLNSNPPQGNPFRYAFAAQLLALKDKQKEAKEYLNRSIIVFENGLGCLEEMNINPEAWYEYTVHIMRAAGDLKDHRQVLDLYRRFEQYHVNWENRYKAGVAYFNLKRYKEAAFTWEPLNKIGNFTVPLQRIAFLMGRRVIPHFELHYIPPSWDEVKESLYESGINRKKQEEIFANGHIRIILLDIAFDEKAPEKQRDDAFKLLVNYGCDWGKILGLQILQSPNLPEKFKLTVASTLTERGVFKEGDAIPIILNGRKEMIALYCSNPHLKHNPAMERVCNDAILLRDQGKVDQAISVLEPYFQKGNYYPRAMMILGNLYRTNENWELAINLFETLNTVFPCNSVVDINLAEINLETGNYKDAIKYINSMEHYEISAATREKAELILREAKTLLKKSKKALSEKNFEDKLREEVEAQEFSSNAGLKQGLNNMPDEWLLSICAVLGLDAKRFRPEREYEILSYLTVIENLHDLVGRLSQAERDLLLYLLERGGTAHLSAVSRKFGKMAGDGYFWNQKAPQSTPGKLWSKALIIVGKTLLGDRNTKIAAIPIELREPLQEIMSLR